VRRFWKLTDLDDLNPWEIPTLEREEDLGVPYRLALQEALGADGAFDLHGVGRPPMAVGEARIGFALYADSVADFDALYRAMLLAACGAARVDGLRKLWRYDPFTGGDQRWSYARLAARPPLQRNRENAIHLPVSLDFRLPDPHFFAPLTAEWLTAHSYTAEALAAAVVGEPIAPDYTFAVFTITSAAPPDGYAFNLINDGDLESQRVVFRFASQAVNGFTNPKIENLTTGAQFQVTGTGATANHVLSVNAAPGLGRARLSTDGGYSWADETPNLALGATQAVLMELQPGTNSMRYTDAGTPNLKLYVWLLHSHMA
jgi:hypothetical protein